MVAVVIQIDAWDPVANAAVVLRAGSHNQPDVCHLNAQVWWPVIAKLPALRLDLFDGSFGGAITAPSSSLSLAVEPWPLFGRYALADARFRLWTGEPGAAWSSFVLRFDGRVSAQPAVADGVAEIAFAVDDRWLDTPLLSLFAGTGGTEGETAQKGTPKPLAIGAPRYVPGVLIDSVNTIVCVNGYGSIQAVEAALERLARFGGTATNYVSYASLAAANIPPGQIATCRAAGCIRHGAPLTGQPSYLIQGDNSGADGWARLPGKIIRRIATLAGGAAKISNASLDALDVARPWPLSLWLADQVTARDIIQRIAASVNAVAGVTWLGQLFVAPVDLGTPTVTLRSDGSSLPPVGDVSQIANGPPFWRSAIKAEVTWTVHAPSDVAFTAALVERGRYGSTVTYREGNIVDLGDGSRWLYIAAAASSGHAPPTSGTSNAWWSLLSPAIDPQDLGIEPGATRNAYRGDWAAGVAYIRGDIVTYNGASYLTTAPHTSAALSPPPNANMITMAAAGTPGAGAQPLQTQYSINGTDNWHSPYKAGDAFFRTSNDGGGTWSASARFLGEAGNPGVDGQYTSFLFRRAGAKPATPTAAAPSGWADGPPADNGQALWMTQAQFRGDTKLSAWSTPIQMTAYALLTQWSVNGTTDWHAGFVTGDKYIRTSADGGTSWSASAKAVGEDGATAPLLVLSASSSTFSFDGQTRPAPAAQTITISAKRQNAPGAISWAGKLWKADNSPHGDVPIRIQGDEATLDVSAFDDVTAYASVVASIGSLTDTLTIWRLTDGQNAVVGFLSNEAVTVPASNSGAVTSLAGASGTFRVFRGLAELTALSSTTFTVVDETGCDVSIDQASGAYALKSLSANSGSATLRATVDGGLTIDKVFTAAKSRGGAAGVDGQFTSFAFKRSKALPDTPTDSADVPDGWSDSPPADDGNPLWMTKAPFRGPNKLGDWSTPIQLTSQPLLTQWSVNGSSKWHPAFATGDKYLRTSADGGVSWSAAAKVVGENGEDGSNGADGEHANIIFRRALSQPATPTSAAVTPPDWSDSPPKANGNPLWMSKAQFRGDSKLSAWSTPVQLEGEKGDKGDPGKPGRDAIPFYQSDEPANPVEGDTWLNPDTKVWKVYRDGQWVLALGKFAAYDLLGADMIVGRVISAQHLLLGGISVDEIGDGAVSGAVRAIGVATAIGTSMTPVSGLSYEAVKAGNPLYIDVYATLRMNGVPTGSFVSAQIIRDGVSLVNGAVPVGPSGYDWLFFYRVSVLATSGNSTFVFNLSCSAPGGDVRAFSPTIGVSEAKK